MSASGPSGNAILTAGAEPGPASSFVLVDIDEKVTNLVGQHVPASFASLSRFGDRETELKVEVGDSLIINVFEAGADGLFSSAENKATTIRVVVDQDGKIFVPYVGAIRASGRTLSELRAFIESVLVDKAIQPQVQLLVDQSLANSVTIISDTGQGGKIQLPVSGFSVLDLLASQGLTTKTYETRVVLRRGNKVASADVETLFDEPKQNIAVQPGDTFLIASDPRRFIVLGNAGAQRVVPFPTRKVSLAQAIGLAGGLDDNRANPAAVFIFRFEPDYVAKAISERAITAPQGTMVPVVYRINMREPKALFTAQLFNLRNDDILYLAAHPIAELSKFLNQIFGPFNSVSAAVRTTATLPAAFEN